MDTETDNDYNIVSLDGDVGNSTYIEISGKKHPNRFIQCFIAEQNIVQVSQGLSCLGLIPVFSTFSAFLTRAYDQFRMNNINQCNIKIYGTHSGCSIGEDGGSQMGFEDISMFTQLFNCVVLYPTDGYACYHAMQLILNHKGMCYIKSSRPEGELLYNKDTKFEIGKCQLLKHSDKDDVLVVSAGVTIYEVLKAYEILKNKNINVRIIDLFSIHPIDKDELIKSLSESQNKLFIIED